MGPGLKACCCPNRPAHQSRLSVEGSYHKAEVGSDPVKGMGPADDHHMVALAELEQAHGHPIEMEHPVVHEDDIPDAGCNCCRRIVMVSQAADS